MRIGRDAKQLLLAGFSLSRSMYGLPSGASATSWRADCPKQHIVQSTLASIITVSNALTNKNLSSATRLPAASTTVLRKLR
jgi:hypothetical protein